jgi:hypothetical protein
LIAYFSRIGTLAETRAFVSQEETAAMATNTSTFFAGMGTTIFILALGFGGGLLVAKTVMAPPFEQQARAPIQLPMRVILPASADPAQPPQLSPTTAETVSPPPLQPPIKEAVLPVTTVEKVDTRKAETEERAHRKRSAERKTKRLAAEKAKRQQQIEQGQGQMPIVAFGSDEARQSGGPGFFGN